MKKRSLIFTAIFIMFSLLPGCVAQQTAQTTGSTTVASTTTNTSATTVSGEKPKLTYWMRILPDVVNFAKSNAELPFFQELQERLNIDIEFQHPPAGMEDEQFKLLLVSRTLPDIIEYDWYNKYPTGPNGALSDGIIIRLNDLIEEKAPNYKAVLAEDPHLNKLVKTDAGDYYVFAQVRDHDLMRQKPGGFIFREDMLKKIDMDVPSNISEWHTVLTAFKNELNLPSPFSALYTRIRSESAFTGAFGIFGGFYHDNNIIKYGFIEQGYKDYIAEMSIWYKEGLLDKDLITIDQKGVDGKFTTHQVGATYGSPDSGLGVYMQMMTKDDPSVVLVGAPYPSLKEGDIRKYGVAPSRYTTAESAAITAQCKDLNTAVRLLDYAYSEEGYMFFNFGTEGVSYNLVDGKPVFVDFITNNPDGKTFKQAMGMFCRAGNGGPFVKSLAPVMLQRAFPQQNEAANLFYSSVDWSNSLPPITLTKEESEIVANVMSEVNTLAEEMTIKIIVGEQSVDSFDTYVAQMKSAGIANAIAAYQTAFERFNAR